ncbi:polyprenyl diphosphate synthase [Thiobacillus sp. 65-1402]|uniref:polyprenyl diphosphate synthase n=1 Tax=Thiobacillus sp. 65-1402 TaxID=1895861 RepID=UPI000A4C6439|nr:polyprenyl diphosphate synthase [Thiobacillus sp. 65-1402]
MSTRSEQAIPAGADVPRHIAIIMDGNGRWAKRRLMPRVAGHRKGVEALRGVIRACAERGVPHLTVFAFSSENWRRPQEEVSLLMELFMRALENEVARLHENDIRFRVVGDLSGFSERIQSLIRDAEALTRDNARLTFTVAANYGGRWDIVQAVKKLMASSVAPEAVNEAALAQHLSMADLPEPDLFIRTGGEQRISNFLLWQLAYTELYFTDALWPDFDAVALDAAIASFRTRERRFGCTSEQVRAAS